MEADTHAARTTARTPRTCDVEDVAQASGGADVDDERRALRLCGEERMSEMGEA